MVMKTFANGLVASGPLVLFLLVTATTVPQYANAVCDEEWDACFDDTVCNSCYYDWGEDYDFDAYHECFGDYPDIDYGAEIDWCFIYGASYCCKDESNINGYDCLGSREYVAHAICMTNNSVVSSHSDKGDGCTTLACNDGTVAALADLDDDNTDVAGDDAGEDSDDAGAVGDDAGTTDDDANIAGDTTGSSRAGSSSPSVAFTLAGGVALLIGASFLGASL